MTVVEVLVAIAIVVTLAALVVGAASRQPATSRRPLESWALQTVRYDGHLWVTNYSETFISHHPDCDLCSKGEQPCK